MGHTATVWGTGERRCPLVHKLYDDDVCKGFRCPRGALPEVATQGGAAAASGGGMCPRNQDATRMLRNVYVNGARGTGK